MIATNQRIRKLRRWLDLTQQEFADRIGVSRANIGKYETEISEPSAAVLSLICYEFNVNEEWLRTGNGEMFAPDAGTEIEQLVKKYHLSRGMQVFIEKLVKTKPEVQETLINLILETSAGIESIKEMGANPATSDFPGTPTEKHTMTEMSREEIHSELDRQLDEEKEAVGNALGYGRGNSDMATN